MQNDPIPTPSGNGPWRLLILDRDPADPKWILTTVALHIDVRPAVLDAEGKYTGWQAASDWIAEMVGRPVALVPMTDVLAWRVDEGGQPR
jgi:hypothetical protein